MVRFKAFLTGFGISALALTIWGGCDSSERVQEPSEPKPRIGTTDLSGSSEFDRELIAAKNGTADPIQQVRAMTAVLDKYGVAHPPATELAGMADENADEVAAPVGPAAKTASHTWSPVRRDFQASNGIHTYRGAVTVGDGQAARFEAIGKTDNVDPFLVAYYVDDNPAVSTAYKVRIIGFNDDFTGMNRNSLINWFNNTGNSKTIQFVAFAYSSSTRGKGRISTSVNGSSATFVDREIGGLKQFGGAQLTEPSGCTTPLSTRIQTWRLSGSERGAVLVVDTKAMRGGHLQTHLNTSASLDLPWVVWNPYPSLALLYQPYQNVLPANWAQTEVPTQYRFTQTDRYGCVD